MGNGATFHCWAAPAPLNGDTTTGSRIAHCHGRRCPTSKPNRDRFPIGPAWSISVMLASVRPAYALSHSAKDALSASTTAALSAVSGGTFASVLASVLLAAPQMCSCASRHVVHDTRKGPNIRRGLKAVVFCRHLICRFQDVRFEASIVSLQFTGNRASLPQGHARNHQSRHRTRQYCPLHPLPPVPTSLPRPA